MEICSFLEAVLCLLEQVLVDSIWDQELQLSGFGSVRSFSCSLSVKLLQVIASFLQRLLDLQGFC